MLGVDSVMANKMTLELDFRRAWRNWPHRTEFGSIKVGPSSDDLLTILHASGRRPRNKFAYWESAWPFIPVLEFDNWTYEEVAEIITESVPAIAWHDLVRSWLRDIPKTL
jgi:hypothetical protein